MVRVKVCFVCKKYHPISIDNHENIKRLDVFKQKHCGHMTQVVNLDELEKKHVFDPQYSYERIEV